MSPAAWIIYVGSAVVIVVAVVIFNSFTMSTGRRTVVHSEAVSSAEPLLQPGAECHMNISLSPLPRQTIALGLTRVSEPLPSDRWAFNSTFQNFKALSSKKQIKKKLRLNVFFSCNHLKFCLKRFVYFRTACPPALDR